MPRASFERLNTEREKLGESLFANPRNAAAGSLRQLDPKVTAKRDLDIFIFNLQRVEGRKFKTHVETLEFLKEQGFKVIPIHKKCSNIDEVIREIEEIRNLKDKLPYDIDGAVVKVNDLEKREILGQTAKEPRWLLLLNILQRGKKQSFGHNSSSRKNRSFDSYSYIGASAHLRFCCKPSNPSQ